VYRIMQEALANVVRHASAKSARIEVKKHAGAIDIIVADDGKGFEAKQALVRQAAPHPVDNSTASGFQA